MHTSQMAASAEFFHSEDISHKVCSLSDISFSDEKISFPSAPSGREDPAVDFKSRTISMLWATGSHSLFEVVCFSLLWSLLPCQYFTSLKAVFPSVPAHNWGMAAIVVQRLIPTSAEFCDKYTYQDFSPEYVVLNLAMMSVWARRPKERRGKHSGWNTHTVHCSFCTERCECQFAYSAGLSFTDSPCRERWIGIFVRLLRRASPVECLNAELICLLRPPTQNRLNWISSWWKISSQLQQNENH